MTVAENATVDVKISDKGVGKIAEIMQNEEKYKINVHILVYLRFFL